MNVTATGRRWLAAVVDTDAGGAELGTLLHQLAGCTPRGLLLVLGDVMPLTPDSARVLPVNAPLAEQRYFIGRALAQELTGQARVAEAVEALGRQSALTAKQMELTALSTLDLRREDLVRGLGVSANTVKTRVRQLLRLHDAETMDALGKRVLRVALEIATGVASEGAEAVRGDWEPGATPVERGAIPRRRPRVTPATAHAIGQ